MTPYTFIAPDPRSFVRAHITLWCNISSSWDHHRNYPLMPIHKSVGHFQSPARNSRRNTVAVHSHMEATSTTTATFEHMYTNFVPSPGTNIRVSFSTIRGHEQGETSWFLSPNFPSLALLSSSLFLSLDFSLLLLLPFFRCDFRFRTANQPTRTRHDYLNGFNGLRTFNRSSE